MHPPQVEGRAGAVGTLGGRFPDRDDLRQQVVGILPATTVKMAINQGREIGATREQVRAHLELRSHSSRDPGNCRRRQSSPYPVSRPPPGGRFSASMVTAASASTEQHGISSPRREQAITRFGGLPHVAGRRTGAATLD
jgi:hypothetical protein